jgi:hypothetical protein
MIPFAGIVDVNSLPANAKLNEWKMAELLIVFFSKLYLTQDKLVIAQLFNNTKLHEDHDDYVHVGVWQKNCYLYNGHHRVTKAALAGEVTILARAIYFD